MPDSKALGLDHVVIPNPTGKNLNRKFGYFIAGVAVLGLVVYCLPVPHGMSPAAFRTLGIAVITTFWWVTETLPIPVTALMVPVFLHITGVMSIEKAMVRSFGDTTIPFFIGVLTLSVAFSKSGLCKRLTYSLLAVFGTKSKSVLAVFLVIGFLFTKFMTDVAVVAMMLPFTVSLLQSIDVKPGESNFGRAMMMAVIFGSTLGGACTPSGVTANIITMSFLQKNAQIDISYLQWSAIATPIFAVAAIIAYFLILKIFPPEIKELPYGKEQIKRELEEMGSWTRQDMAVLVVFLIAIALWMTGSWTKLPMALVSLAMIGFLTMPEFGVFTSWKEISKNIEWGALMLVVGGLALGEAAMQSGLAQWIVLAALQPMAAIPAALQPMAITLLVAVDSLGFSSFAATAAVNVPLIIAYAQAYNFPVASLAMSAGFAASTHFILVTESPSFVLPYAYGYFSFMDLFKIGAIMTLVCVVLVGTGFLVFGMP